MVKPIFILSCAAMDRPLIRRNICFESLPRIEEEFHLLGSGRRAGDGGGDIFPPPAYILN